MEQVLLRSRPRTRPWMVLSLASPLILVLGWTALWLFAQREAGRTMDGLIAGEAGRGREWTCPDRQIDGFPFELRVSCAAPTFHGRIGGEIVDVSAASATVFAYLYQPNAIEAAVTGPVTVGREGGASPAVLSWSALNVQARLIANDRARVAVVADQASLENQGETSRADHAEFRMGPAAGKPPQDRAYDVWLKVEGAVVPALDAAAGTSEPMSVDEKGVLTAVRLPGGEAWPLQVEAWRQAGGAFTLTSLSLAKGDARAEARGELGLDEDHRLAGRLQTSLRGFDALAAHFGVPVRAVAVGGMLSKLLTGRASRPAADQSSVDLPVVFADGRVSVGPFVTPLRLAPFY